MALLSPGIEVIERDASLVVPIAGSSFAVYCGNFTKGPCDIQVLITSVQDLIDTFGKPTNTNYNDWYQVYSFLQYSNTIWVTRVGDALGANGVVQGINAVTEVGGTITNVQTNASFIPNIVDFHFKYDLGSINKTGKVKIIAKSMGTYGNDISVSLVGVTDFNNAASSNIVKAFQYGPTSADELAVVVYKGINIVETFLVSVIPGTKDYNNKSIFIDDVINRQSVYIYTITDSNITDANTLSSITAEATVNSIVVPAHPKLNTLEYGIDSDITSGMVSSAYATLYGNKEEIDIDIVIVPEDNTDVAQFCADRADVIGYMGVTFDDVVGIVSTQAVSNLVTAIGTTYNFNNKYLSFIGNYVYMYDRYNDKYRWINAAGHCAGLRAKTSNDRNPWFASAGLNVGILKGVTKLAQNFSQGQRDLLYKNAVNTIVSFSGQGIALWGQKTATQKPSSFDRVNVRMLFNYAERAITKMSKYVLFEQNSDTTRNMFVSTVKPFFDRIKAGQGVDDYLIVCDLSNNTDIVRQNNQFVADFYLKPTYTIEFIQLRFTAVGASISFSQVVQ
jgi:phage tail sheath protein FI